MASIPSCRSGKTIQSNERNLIACVIKCCDEETKQRFLTIPLNQATARAARYTNKSTTTISRIRNELRRCPEGTLQPKKRKPSDIRKAVVDSFDRYIIRDAIEEFYLIEHTVPTCRKLLPILKERLNFKWKRTVLRKILAEMGYQWETLRTKKSVLLEKEDIVNARCEYLQKIRQLKLAGKPVYYLDETWVDTKLTFRKCWQNKYPATKVEVLERVHIVHVGGENGFLDGCELIYRSGDGRGQLTWETFKTWICNTVIPRLATPSVIVVHNIWFQETSLKKAPTKSTSKKETTDYLRTRGVPCDELMRKLTLISLMDNIVDKEKAANDFKKLFTIHGHTVVRLPADMCDLNPIELAWRKIREYLLLHSEDMPPKEKLCNRRLEEFVKAGIKHVSKNAWTVYCSYVSELEDHYWERDACMEEVIEKIITGEFNCDNENSEPDSSDDTDDSEFTDEGSEESLAELDSKPLPEIVEYRTEQPTVTQSIQVDPQPTVMEKIKMTKRILDKSKAAPVASSSAAEPASRSFADVGQVGQAVSSASPVVEPASRGFSCGGRPLEKRPRHETAVDDDFDDDKMFLLSLCGKMKHLSPANNMQFRLGVQQLLFDLLRSESQTNLQNGSRSGNAFYTPATAQINPVSSSSVSSFSEVLIKEEVEETLTDESPLMVDESFPDEVKTEENSTERYSDNSGNMDYN